MHAEAVPTEPEVVLYAYKARTAITPNIEL